jgi:hypothetical protein
VFIFGIGISAEGGGELGGSTIQEDIGTVEITEYFWSWSQDICVQADNHKT